MPPARRRQPRSHAYSPPPHDKGRSGLVHDQVTVASHAALVGCRGHGGLVLDGTQSAEEGVLASAAVVGAFVPDHDWDPELITGWRRHARLRTFFWSRKKGSMAAVTAATGASTPVLFWSTRETDVGRRSRREMPQSSSAPSQGQFSRIISVGQERPRVGSSGYRPPMPLRESPSQKDLSPTGKQHERGFTIPCLH